MHFTFDIKCQHSVNAGSIVYVTRQKVIPPFKLDKMVSIWLLSSVGRVQLAFSPMSNYSEYSQGCLSATALIGCAGNMTIEWTGLILPLFQCEARMAFQPLARKYFFYSNTARKLALLASSLTAD